MKAEKPLGTGAAVYRVVKYRLGRFNVNGALIAHYRDFSRIKRKPPCKPYSALQSGFVLV